MKILSRIGFLIAMVMLATLLSPIGSANALDGCNGKYQKRGDNWTYSVRNLTPTVIGGVRSSKFTLRGTLIYWYCPNGIKPAKIKPVAVDWSWSQPKKTHEHAFFQRVIFDAYVTNRFAQTSVPGAFSVLDDGTWHNSNTQLIPKHRQTWMSGLGKNRWFVNYEIVNAGPAPNTSGPFVNPEIGGFENFIRPSAKSTKILGEWKR